MIMSARTAQTKQAHCRHCPKTWEIEARDLFNGALFCPACTRRAKIVRRKRENRKGASRNSATPAVARRRLAATR
jgi:uncharacterized Zn finger protein (UPF0148 family)